MRTVSVALGARSYPIYIGHGILGAIGARCAEHDLGRKVAVVTDETVGTLYGSPVVESLRAQGFEPIEVVIPAGEAKKCLATMDGIFEQLIRAQLDRGCAILALGGGVIGDLAGFVAATYLRGVAFVQVPTTVLAQADSGVGGKVAVNHPLGKNLIGAFHQPRFVLMDTDVLRTLPDREVRAGLVEVIKHGMIRDEGFFAFLEAHIEELVSLRASAEVMERMIERNCQIKGEVVGLDEREQGLRAILNYGHTVGHALEALGGYGRLRHGEALGLGMRVAGRIAVGKGLLAEEALNRQNQLLAKLGVPDRIVGFEPMEILEKMRSDKKVRNGKVRFVLPERIGGVVIRDDVTEKEVLESL
ncbi:MAG: 3-dehydroquinate synthase [Candidatus Latescibacterota bacterium]